ncbi:tripartite-type tricarboxylate transporter receptor subunit TctC [Advenella incenata]|uniref:Tripartite-type tricarboxylate transporter receptor subunit TctC n=1 Tax=Advenella incenata TaxID=267800 RepID=A0A4Q7VD55_9BURK|nr:tripartite tricarboxylate transporter substrate binding protein [Advenella incenata]RZT94846.1 tripartite-type tricarboxylate transporter receptor subunit TctC [Advenella incenata]
MLSKSNRRNLLKVAVAFPFFNVMNRPVIAQILASGQPIRLIVPAPVGSSPDFFARLIAQQATKSLGKPIIVENRPGAAGIIGAEYVAKSVADGTTLLYAHSGVMVMNPHIYSKLRYDPLNDFVAISHTLTAPCVLATAYESPYSTLPDLLIKAMEMPGEINYASYGAGTLAHVAMEALCAEANVKFTHIPYSGQPTTDLISNVVQLCFEPVNTALPLIREKKLKALAITSSKRIAVLPTVSTISETIPNFYADTWQGIYAPSGTAEEIIMTLAEHFSNAVNVPTTRRLAFDQGLIPVGSGASDLAAFTNAEFQRWGEVVKRNNIRIN